MASTLFLTTEDYHLVQTKSSRSLRTSIPGLSLVLIYSNQCKWCDDLKPIFRQLSGSIHGCQFGMLNADNNKSVVAMSHDTPNPIVSVPHILLYADGKPMLKYSGPYDLNTLQEFVIDSASKIEKRQAVATPEQDARNEVPEYSIGVPLFGKPKVCYLDYSDAYSK